jgi:glycosyltransferase involved in cell wall biosynthesis
MYLSCIIVARNEEKNIERCILSVIRALCVYPETEVLLVDSCSNDETINVASKLSTRIIRLRSDWPQSPSAGRFLGVLNTSGRFILFIDGDMELIPGWLECAVDFLEKDDSAAAVVGRLYDRFQNKDGSSSSPSIGVEFKKMIGTQTTHFVPGSALFKRDILLKAGNFDPFLMAEEEADISDRIERLGFKLYFFDKDAVYHYCIFRDSLDEIKRRLRSQYYHGIVQFIAKAYSRRSCLLLWRRFAKALLFSGVILLALVGMFASWLLGNFYFLIVDILLLVCILGMAISKKQNVKSAIALMINYLLTGWCFFLAFFLEEKSNKKSNQNYPTDVIVIK